MAYFVEGAGYCKIDEYLEYEPLRLQAGELRAGELYMIMFALKREVQSNGAARIPARVQTVEPAVNNQKLVVSTILTDDLKPLYEVTTMIKDGYWLGVEDDISFDDVDPYNAYYKGFRDEIDDGLARLLNSSELLVGS